VRLLQLRLKTLPTGEVVALARQVKALCANHGARLIINDRVDVARLVDADGVHVGQDDLPPREARALLAPGKIIGFSTHNPTQLAAAARAGEADYLAFGPVFPTRSKHNPDPVVGLDALRAARRACSLPLVAIGGIDGDNLAATLATGVDCAALISAIIDAPDIGRATAAMLRLAN
jgi:thiamine-phosphate pyrophosphorylase